VIWIEIARHTSNRYSSVGTFGRCGDQEGFQKKFKTSIESFAPQFLFRGNEMMIGLPNSTKSAAAGGNVSITIREDHMPCLSTIRSHNLVGALYLVSRMLEPSG
jgi:hypothetical protein